MSQIQTPDQESSSIDIILTYGPSDMNEAVVNVLQIGRTSAASAAEPAWAAPSRALQQTRAWQMIQQEGDNFDEPVLNLGAGCASVPPYFSPHSLCGQWGGIAQNTDQKAASRG